MVQRNSVEQYRWTGKERKGQDHQGAAIILPPPPAPLLIQFFASITPHLTAKQLRARTCYGRPGVRRDLSQPSPRKRSRARAKPSLPPCKLPHAETCAMLPELLPE
jgi:hypothetical protein